MSGLTAGTVAAREAHTRGGRTVRKVVVYELLSLDGVAESPDEFILDWDEVMDANLARVISTQDDVILGRRSIRGYKPDPVPRELIEEIIALAMRSPSSRPSLKPPVSRATEVTVRSSRSGT